MKYLRIGFVLFLLVLRPAMAEETQASEASIRELIEVTQSKKLFDGAMMQMDTMLKNMIKQELAGHPPTAEQKLAIDSMQAKIIALFDDDMKWESLEPTMIDIYRKSFTQSELDGMLTFYKSSAGQAMLAKMPIVMQNTMQAMQGRMAILMPELKKIEDDTLKDIRASSKK